jgi:hypothetical protein
MADGERPRGRLVTAATPETVPAELEAAAADARATRHPGRLGTALDLVPLGLAIVAEAAWIAVAAGLVAEYTLQEPQLGIVGLAAFVLAGVIAARLLTRPAGERWPSVALFLVVLAGMIGWLAAPVASSKLAAEGVVPAIGLNVAGWLAALAVLRGFAHAKTPVSAATLATVFGVGVPCLALAALAGGMIAEPHRARFLADATVYVVVFAGAATLALAIARLTAVGAGSGFDWRRNPTWVALLVVLVLTTLAVAVPASIASPLIALVAGAAVGPILVIGLILGFNRGTLRLMLIAGVGTVLVLGIFRLLGGAPVALNLNLGGALGGDPAPPDPQAAAPIWLLIVVIVAVTLVLILARLWAHRAKPEPADLDEVRQIDRGDETEAARPRRWRFGRGIGGGPEPVDAVGAYLRLLADIDRRPAVRREPYETPAAHAARLRAAGGADLSLDLLAADYALARFGGVELSAPEQRRAVGRWRRLRRSLGPGQPAASRTTGAGGAESAR